jgi:CheY-like chemotaxis protein
MNKILFIDDSPLFRDPVADSLRRKGYEVITAASGVEGLKALDTGLPSIILLDVAMPEMDGLTFLKKMRELELSSSIPVLLITAVTEADYLLTAKSLGVVDCMVKSYFSLSDLQRKIEEIQKRY